MVALIGRPNVGKSSLVNYLLGFDLSIVSHRPQTTRNRFHCTFTIDKTEIVLVDTPGVHFSNQEMNKRMNEQAVFGSQGADLNLLLIDLSAPVLDELEKFKNKYGENLKNTWVVFTKSDLAQDAEEKAKGLFQTIQAQLPQVQKYFVISSKEGEGVHLLTGALCDAAPLGPHLYPRGEVSNKNERFFVSEYIREQAFRVLNEELPYELAVVIDDFQDSRGKTDSEKEVQVRIVATILVNRPSQRAIVVGSKGSMIRKIGEQSRKKIEALLGGKCFINLHVKVSPKWFRNNFVLEELGLPRALDSSRVWRKK